MVSLMSYSYIIITKNLSKDFQVTLKLPNFKNDMCYNYRVTNVSYMVALDLM